MDDRSKVSPATYAFRFGASGNVIRLTQEQLDHFPYLAALVAHTDDFLHTRNQEGEYLLSDPICYDSFMVIFRSIIRNQPHILFTALSYDVNVLSLLQLYDYLCIRPLSLPILKGTELIQLNPLNTDQELNDVGFRRATLSEVRNRAAQLIVAISKDEYDLNDEHTRASIFTLLQSIFASPKIFNSKFRYHTLTIVKKHCSLSFSASQRQQLPSSRALTRNDQMDSWIYMTDDDESLPEKFITALAWKDYLPSQMKCCAPPSLGQHSLIMVGRTGMGKSTILRALFEGTGTLSSLPDIDTVHYKSPFQMTYDFHFTTWMSRLDRSHFMISIDDNEQKNYEEAQSARSGRFNTQPKRPEVDRFKHRSGPKAQKHR